MNSLIRPKISGGLRLASMLLDHVFMSIVIAIVCLPFFISDLTNPDESLHNINDSGPGSGWLFLGIAGYALYFCKDCINGRSIAKRILGLQVVEISNGEPASPMKCMVRNIPLIFWPVEAIVALVNPESRLGDKMAGTRLTFYERSNTHSQVKGIKIIIPFVIVYSFFALLFLPFQFMSFSTIKIVESSYNEKKSKEMENLLTDSLGNYMTPDVRIYDSIENKRFKYISTVIILKDDYFEEGSFEKIMIMSQKLIYSKYNFDTFTGWIEFKYQAPGYSHSRSSHIGLTVWR